MTTPSFSPEATPEQSSLEKKGEILPVDAKRELVVESIANNPSSVIVGETGSGKTTRIPVFLLEQFPNKNIIITSPRVLPARSVSQFVAASMGGVLGGEVGLITREHKKVSNETRATFMTDGVLLSMLRKDPMLLECDVVMVDEAHERSINIDLALGLLKQAQAMRQENGKSELKIVVTSATIEEEKIADYFNGSPVAKVEGRMYPVEISYHPMDNGDEIEKKAAQIAMQITESGKEGDILIFMPGEEEIKTTIAEIEKYPSSHGDLLLPLYGAMNPQDQDLIFKETSNRKIIVSTNIAETSVTIEGVKHVIDSGLVRQKNYHPDTGIHSLETQSASKANMNQRSGRAGRTSPGTSYRLISKEEFNEREDFQKPELLRSDLGEVVLRMKDMGIKDVEGFDFIDKPPRATIHNAVVMLQSLGALDQEGEITDIGKEMAHLELRPDLSRMLIEAKHLGALHTMVDVCSLLSSQKQILLKPKRENPEDMVRESNQSLLRKSGSDPLTLLNVWNAWVASSYSGAFAHSHLLNGKALKEVGLLRNQLLKTLASAGIEVEKEKQKPDPLAIEKCLLKGAPNSLFFSENGGKSYSPTSDEHYLEGVRVFPGSSAFPRRSQFLIAMNIYKNDKNIMYARTCHSFTLENIEKIVPEAVEQKPIGTPQKEYFSEKIMQTYGVYLYGKFVQQKSIEIDTDSLPLETLYGSWSKAVERILPAVAARNHKAFETYRSYHIRSKGKLEKVDQNAFYKAIAKGIGALSKQDMQKHAEDFQVSLDDLISPEHRKELDALYPSDITVAGRKFGITYGTYYSSAVSLNILDAFDADYLLEHENDLPAFLHEEKILLDYRFTQYPTIASLKEARIREKEQEEMWEKERRDYLSRTSSRYDIAPLINQSSSANTSLGDILKKRLKEQEEEGKEQAPATVGNSPKETGVKNEQKQEKKPMTEEEKKKYREDLQDIKELVKQVRYFIEKTNPALIKSKDSLLDKAKTLSSDCNAYMRILEGNEALSYERIRGKVVEFKQTLKATLKGMNAYSKEIIENTLTLFQENKRQLAKARERNEVKASEELQIAISKKCIILALEGKILTENEADAALIDIV